jgi:2-keto-4-pentenoate hydratase/2-oxohepta-3-ene-1,7-dioic acid hydratase in catechol pathway
VKLATFEVPTPLGPVERIGAVWGHPSGGGATLIDLTAAAARRFAAAGEPEPQRLADCYVPPDLLRFLEMGPTAMARAREALGEAGAALDRGEGPVGPWGERLVYPAAEVRLRAPLPRPASLRDFLAFEAHTKASFARRNEPVPDAWYRMPVYYKGNHRSILGPGDDLVWPRFTERLDYELELACVIGRRGRDLSTDEAPAFIAGYMVMNDWSARDVQKGEMQCRLGPAKGKDFGTSLGPWLVTPDELPAPLDLRMVARVNGEVWSDGRSGTAHWSFPQMIAHVSNEETLYPGDVLGSGTVGGGCGLELDRWLKAGDVVELEIEGLGILRNRVVRRGQER